MRGRRLHRLLQFISLLRGPSSWNARRLADHFRTSQRNIYRDLAVLELAGVPFYYDPAFGEGGGYRIKDSFFFPNIGVTDQECFDLAILTQLVEKQGIPSISEICHVRDKLLSTLPAKQQALITRAAELFDSLSVPLTEHNHCCKIMQIIQKALLARKQIEGSYKILADKRPTKVQLQPRQVFLGNGEWYLVAHDNKKDTTTLFHLTRFQNIKVLDTPMTIAPQFNLREFLGNAWCVQRGDRDHHLEILFTPEAAAPVQERRWHPTQETERCPDGSLLFRASVSGLEEVKYWVLGWGPKAKVLKPKELVEEVKKLARAILDL